jgi:hypothetical protein
MSWRDLVLPLRSLVAPRRVEPDLDDELAFHLEMAARKHAADGVPEAEARARARARFGPAALAADACRDVRGTTLVTGLGRDVVYAWRALIRTPLDPVAYAVGLGTVSAICLFAAAVPALRGARSEPMTALRED